ncbi:MAG: ABC transporter ATP-binding protein [Patescibacteria group bacterium]|nr:ABC transporter ATP-binding protein [Patescibacteria group bacterium]
MIILERVNKIYHIDQEFTLHVLKKVSLKIRKGEFISIIGPSGSGKSTLMYLVGLLDRPTSGKILVEGKEIETFNDDDLSSLRNEFVGFVFQQFNLINKLTVLENIILPTIYSRKRLDFNPKERALYFLKKFGLEGKETAYPNKISGGQQQRVAIIRALMMKPKLILADEPTGNLDSKTGLEIMKLIAKLNHEEKITVLVVTHDIQVASFAERLIEIKDGKICRDTKVR